MPKIKNIMVLSLLTFSMGSWSAQYSDEEMRALLKSNNPSSAYQYAVQYLPQQEGSPDFDLYFGIAAIDSGFASQGVFALERVLLTYPDDALVRLELARGYYLLEEYNRAELEFNTVLNNDIPDKAKYKVEQYLDAIRARQGRFKTTHFGSVSLRAGSDDNVNSGPDATLITIPLLNITQSLNESSQSQDDSYNELELDYQINAPLSQSWSFKTRLNFDTRMHSTEDAFDTDNLQADFAFKQRFGENQIEYGLILQDFSVDGDSYRDLQGLSLVWKKSISTTALFQIYTQIATLEYPDQPVRDSQLDTLGFGYTKLFNRLNGITLFSNLYLGAENADQDTNSARSIAERDFFGGNLGVQFDLNTKLALVTSIALQNSDYAGTDIFFQRQREDEYSALDLELNWKITQQWLFEASASIADNTSNIALNDYQRDDIQLGISWQF